MGLQNIKLTIAYDGQGYLGWQKTDTGASIEAVLEKVLQQILQERVTLQAASRTDAGVHASGQIANFMTAKTTLQLGTFLRSINGLLPKEIQVLEIQMMPHHFHPTLDCIGKEYHYNLCYDHIQFPQERYYAWHYPYSLDLINMKEAASLLLGTHDFSALCNFKKNANYSNYERTIHAIELFELPRKCIRFEIKGNNFLYKMVRNLVGLIVYAGRGLIPLEEIQKILKQGDRTKAGITAPAHGLSLFKVFYNSNEGAKDPIFTQECLS